MEEDILSPIITTKVYTPNAIRIATFLGGPWITGYLVAENYKQLNQRDMVGRTWALTIISTIIIITIAIFLPPSVPGFIFPLFYSSLAYLIVKKFQGNSIATHIQHGGQTFNTWRAVAISLTSLILVVIVWAVYFYMHAV